MNEKEQKYANALLLATREELLRADNKASVLLASSGLIVGALVAALLAGDWSPFELSNCVEWLWWFGAASAGCGITALGLAVYPRTTAKRPLPDPDFVAFYGDVRTSDADDIARRISHSITRPGSGTSDQIVQIASIVVRKYRLIQRSFQLFSAAAAMIALSLFINLIFS